MNEEDADSPTLVRLLAYSTGLCVGVWIVHILADRIGAHAREGNGMSTAGINVPELPPPAVETEEEYAERIRNAIRRGDEAYRQGRMGRMSRPCVVSRDGGERAE